MHLRFLIGSGFPYTPTRNEAQVGGQVFRLPDDRHAARFPRYFRLDLGSTKRIRLSKAREARQLRLTAELLNVFDGGATIKYTLIPDGDGLSLRVPTRLTPRTFNLRARVDF